MKLTILMPCLNEAKTLPKCIQRAKMLLERRAVEGEILISDNGSDDGSQQIAAQLGARVVNCPTRGYGAALQYGIEQARGEYIIMGDSDDSYHFDEAWPMLDKLEQGYDVCMGTRLKGKIMPDAMTTLNRYLGNPVLSAIGKLLFKSELSDFHCGMRAFRKDKIQTLSLATTGMEWASEMVVKAKLSGLKMTEVPITLYKDGRGRPPHLRPWRDGWRHLRFMLLHAPTWLFTIPGLAMVTIGILGQLILYGGMIQIGTAKLDVHTMLVLSFLSVLGAQVVFTGLFVRLYSGLHGILPYDRKFKNTIQRLTLEKLLVIALVLGVCGLAGFLYTVWEWSQVNFSELNYRVTMRQLIPSLTLISFAVQGIFNGFMLSILFLKTKPASGEHPS
jgi:glycosyltransferase involved in cell wall biosynthesis